MRQLIEFNWTNAQAEVPDDDSVKLVKLYDDTFIAAWWNHGYWECADADGGDEIQRDEVAAWDNMPTAEDVVIEPVVRLDWRDANKEQPEGGFFCIARRLNGATFPAVFDPCEDGGPGEWFSADEQERGDTIHVTHWAPFPVVPQPKTQGQPKTTTLFWNDPATIKPHSGALCLGQCSRGEVHAVKYSDTDDSWYFADDFDNGEGNPFQVILWAVWPGRVM